MNKRTIILILISGLYLFSSASFGTGPIPDDVRYMLEDIYGVDTNKWPKTIYSKDINADGAPDWLVQQPGCKQNDQCLHDVFLCAKSDGAKCLEYCYTGSMSLAEINKGTASFKCQSTC